MGTRNIIKKSIITNIYVQAIVLCLHQQILKKCGRGATNLFFLDVEKGRKRRKMHRKASRRENLEHFLLLRENKSLNLQFSANLLTFFQDEKTNKKVGCFSVAIVFFCVVSYTIFRDILYLCTLASKKREIGSDKYLSPIMIITIHSVVGLQKIP